MYDIEMLSHFVIFKCYLQALMVRSSEPRAIPHIFILKKLIFLNVIFAKETSTVVCLYNLLPVLKKKKKITIIELTK